VFKAEGLLILEDGVYAINCNPYPADFNRFLY